MKRQPLVVRLELEGVVEVDADALHRLGEAHEDAETEAEEPEVELPLRVRALDGVFVGDREVGDRRRHPVTSTVMNIV